MIIIKEGNRNAKDLKIRVFDCDICGCIWQATKDEYEEDWNIHSIPAYCKCLCCGTLIYAIDTFTDRNHSHIRNE